MLNWLNQTFLVFLKTVKLTSDRSQVSAILALAKHFVIFVEYRGVGKLFFSAVVPLIHCVVPTTFSELELVQFKFTICSA